MSDRELLLSRAKSALIARDFQLAAKLYNKLLKDEPNDLSILNSLGQLYMKSGEDEKALPVYEQIYELDKTNTEPLVIMGGIYRRLKRYEESIAILEEALVIEGTNAQISYNLGFTYKVTGQYESAIQCFEDALEENPEDVLAYNHLGSIYALQGKHEKAVQSYLSGLKVDPNHPILQLNIAKSYEVLEQYDKAQKFYEGALKSKPLWLEATDDYSRLLIKMNKVREAYDLISQTLKTEPEDVRMHTAMGNVYTRQSVLDSAEKEYKTALTYDDEYFPALTGLANSLELQGKVTEAVSTIKKASELEPDDKNVKKQAVHVLLSADYLAEAQKQIFSLYNENKNDPDILNLIGQYYICKGNWKKAEVAFKKISEIAPKYDNFYYEGGKRYKEKGEFQKAEKYLKKAIESNPNDAQSLVVLASMYENMGQLEESLKLYKLAAETDSNNKQAAALFDRMQSRISNLVDNQKGSFVSQEQYSSFLTNPEEAEELLMNDISDEEFEEFEKADTNTAETVLKDDDFDFSDLAALDEKGDDFFDEEFTEDLEHEDDSLLIEKEEENLNSLLNKDRPIDSDNFDEFEKIPEPENDYGTDDNEIPGEEKMPDGNEVPEMPQASDDSDFEEVEEIEDFAPEFEEEPEPKEDNGVEFVESAKEPLQVADLSDSIDELKDALEKAYSAIQERNELEKAKEEEKQNETQYIANDEDFFNTDENADESEEETLPEADDTFNDEFDDEFDEFESEFTPPDTSDEDAPEELEELPEEDLAVEDLSLPVDVEYFPDEVQGELPVEDDFTEEEQIEEESEDTIDEDLTPDEDATIDEEDFSSGEDTLDEEQTEEESDVLFNEETPVQYEKYLELFKSLRGIMDYLPAEERVKFRSSRTRLLLDYIIARLSDEPGLYASAKSLIDTGIVQTAGTNDTALEGIELQNKVLNDLRVLVKDVPDEGLREGMESLLSDV